MSAVKVNSSELKRVAAIIVAAGKGVRAVAPGRSDRPKQYQSIGGDILLSRTVRCFVDHPLIAKVVVVINPDHRSLYDDAISPSDKIIQPVPGGDTRQVSVLSGLKALLPHAPDYVLIHDGARPFVSPDVIEAAILGLDKDEAIISGLPVFDTVKKVRADDAIIETIDRSELRTVQTPQGFHFPVIYQAHRRAYEAGRIDFTDDAAVAEWSGHQVKVVAGSKENIKVTTPEDFIEAEQFLAKTKGAPEPSSRREIRIGSGFDVHAFEPGEAVILGGISIPHTHKLKGHSDADVALHTLTDAIYGALADGDIGHHFPPSDETWKGMDSAHFLKHAAQRVAERGGWISNLDLTIICERPKVGPYRDPIRHRIASLIGLDPSRISVKATTTERLGFTGRGEGIAAQATVAISLPAEDMDAICDEERPFSETLINRAKAILKTCQRKKVKIATAESCTGGLIAGLLTSVAGSSDVVDRGFVTYSNEAKTQMLGVPASAISSHGAVSEPVARAMAEGALTNSDATLAVSVTGVAGPGGGTTAKPVGLVHFGLAIEGDETQHARIQFGDLGRTAVRRSAIAQALNMIEATLSSLS